MRTMRKLLSILFVIIFFNACYSPRYVYSPSTQNIPQLLQKNDFTAAGYFALNSGGTHSILHAPNSSLGLDLHTAYAVTNHFAIMLNQYSRWESNGNGNDFFSGDSLGIKYKRSLTEIGGGYFTPMKNNNSSFQFFAGAATGKFSINEHSLKTGSSFTRFHKSNLTKIFIQPAIIAGQQKKFTASFSLRVSALLYNKIKTDYSDAELEDYFLKDIASSAIIFWEPAMDYKFGFKKIKHLKFDIQFGLSILVNRKFVDYRSLNTAFGIVTDFSGRKKNIKAAKN